MLTKLSSDCMSELITPMFAEWIRIAKLKYGNTIHGVGDDNIYIQIGPKVCEETPVASFGYVRDPVTARFVYRLRVNPYWACMTPEDTIRQVIGHEIAHYVNIKFDCHYIGIEAADEKYKLAAMPNGDGGHNAVFSNICATLGVDNRFSRAFYISNMFDAISRKLKIKILKSGLGSLILDDHHFEYMKKNKISI